MNKEKEIEEAYIELWAAIENGEVDTKFFALRSKFRKTVQSPTADFVKPVVMRDISLFEDKSIKKRYRLSCNVDSIRVESVGVHKLDELSIKIGIDSENLKKFIR